MSYGANRRQISFLSELPSYDLNMKINRSNLMVMTVEINHPCGWYYNKSIKVEIKE